jgi:carbamoyltransferase
MYILGVSAFYHDSAAALIHKGHPVAAAQEERFSRIKHDSSFPGEAIRYCLREAGISAADLDFVVFYEKPLLKFDRLLETYLSFAPHGFRSFVKAMPIWLKEKLFLPRILDRGLQDAFKKRYLFVEHHESHAASAFFPSPFQSAAIVTVDGVGEWATTTLGEGSGNQVSLHHELRFPHSLRLLYSAFTYYTGFRVNSGEYKLMGLAPYGEPVYTDLIKEKLIEIKEDGSFRLDMSYFNYCQGLTMTNRRFHNLFGASPRQPETPIRQFHMDLAASIQLVTQEIIMAISRKAYSVTRQKNLCMAGGVALNCVANGLILKEGPFDRVWIQPAAGDAGGALGAALFVWYQLLENDRRPASPDSQMGSLLGPEFGTREIELRLKRLKAVCQRYPEEKLLAKVVELIADQKVVGWFQGRMEFGPRALGSRSILADARSPEMQRIVNLKIKFRESFRPFAPAVLQEKAAEYFDLEEDKSSPYMLLVAGVSQAKRLPVTESEVGFKKLKQPRSQIPAVTHVDYSARLQTVDERHGRFQKLLRRLDAETRCPVVVNTSFNVRGEPIVCTPEDAYQCFMATEMEALVLGDYLLLKEDQPRQNVVRFQEHVAHFQLD